MGQERSSATTEATEQNMGLSVLFLKQVAASGELHGLHKAGNQFLWLHRQTRDTLGEVEDAGKLDIQLYA